MPNKPRNKRFGSDARLGVANNSILLHASDNLVKLLLHENDEMSQIRLARRSSSKRWGRKSITPTYLEVIRYLSVTEPVRNLGGGINLCNFVVVQFQATQVWSCREARDICEFIATKIQYR